MLSLFFPPHFLNKKIFSFFIKINKKGLHEDLNRVMKKPYVESKDSDGREDSIVAKESWEANKLREDSFVIDTFFGQLKSHVHCLSCGKVSIKFDPFCSLSLPLPVKSTKTVPQLLIFIFIFIYI